MSIGEAKIEAERLSIDEALKLMSVPGMYGVYVLNAGVEHRMSNHSQQVRALNLISGLFAQKAIKAGDPVGIVGGGIAGITAAVVAAFLGAHPSVLEQQPDVLTSFRDSPRYIDPHLYDWPHPRFRRTWSNLPFLTWRSGEAREVIARLRAQWALWERLFPRSITVVRSVAAVTLRAAHQSTTAEMPTIDPELSWITKNGASRARYRAVILAVGFGAERQRVPERPGHRDYWQERDLTLDNVVVVGKGDGALSEVIARKLCVHANSKPEALEENQLASLIRELDTDQRAPKDRSEVDARIKALQTCLADKLANKAITIAPATIRLAIRPDPNVTRLATPSDPADKYQNTFELNRAIIEYLINGKHVDEITICDGSQIHRDKNHRDNEHPEFIVPDGEATDSGCKPTGTEVRCTSIIERAGPLRPLETDFPAVWRALEDAGRIEQGKGLRRGSGFAFTKAEPRRAREKPLLYSDLFDSVTQRDIYHRIHMEKHTHSSGDEVQREFCHALWATLSQRAQRGLIMVLTDNQILDGLFFQHLAADGRWDEFGKLIEHGQVIVRLRQNPEAQLDAYVTGKPFKFSSMPFHGEELNTWMKSRVEGGLSIKGWDDLAEAIEKSPSVLDQDTLIEFCQMRERIQRLVQRIKCTLECNNRIEVTGIQPFPHATSFEDPGGFVYQLDTGQGRDLAVEVFQFGPKRSLAFDRIDQFMKPVNGSTSGDPANRTALVRSDAEAIRSWYSRAYNRAAAVQQDADIFETTHVFDSLWWARACNRDHDPAPPISDERGLRLAKGLRSGTEPLGPLEVPDARAPVVVVPYHMAVLVQGGISNGGPHQFTEWNNAFSLIEYLRDPDEKAHFPDCFHCEFKAIAHG